MLLIKQKRLAQTGRTDLWLPREEEGEKRTRSLGLTDTNYYMLENE